MAINKPMMPMMMPAFNADNLGKKLDKLVDAVVDKDLLVDSSKILPTHIAHRKAKSCFIRAENEYGMCFW